MKTDHLIFQKILEKFLALENRGNCLASSFLLKGKEINGQMVLNFIIHRKIDCKSSLRMIRNACI